MRISHQGINSWRSRAEIGSSVCHLLPFLLAVSLYVFVGGCSRLGFITELASMEFPLAMPPSKPLPQRRMMHTSHESGWSSFLTPEHASSKTTKQTSRPYLYVARQFFGECFSMPIPPAGSRRTQGEFYAVFPLFARISAYLDKRVAAGKAASPEFSICLVE